MARFTFTRDKPEPPIPDPYGSRPPEHVASSPIPRLADNPAYARLIGQENALSRGLEERQHVVERYMINAELSANSTLASGPRKTMLRERLARLEQFPSGIPEPSPEPEAEGLDPTVAVALRLAAGEEVEPPRDRDAHIQRLRAEIRTLEAAAAIVRGQMTQVREDASIAVCEALLPEYRVLLREKLLAALALSEVVRRERALIAEVLLSGHAHCPGVLISPPLDPASRLGALDEWDSPISTYKRTLGEMLGIVP
jgi:hypothetical protein